MGQLWDISKISSRDFCIGRHMCHRCVYLLWLALICTVFQRFIYFDWSVCTSFRLFSFRWTFLPEMSGLSNFAIKWSSDQHLKQVFGFPLLSLVRLLLELRELKGDLLYPFFSLFIKSFFSWVWTSTVTSPWLRK